MKMTFVYTAMRVASALCAAMAFQPAHVLAQAYPAKPVKMVIGFAAGGSIDSSGRFLAQRLTTHFGQSFVVENKPGASAQLAMQGLIASPPDGYTIMLMSAGTTISSAKPVNAPFDVRRDIAPVIQVTLQPLALYVTASLPVKTMPELIAYAKANPGKLNYTSVGVGSIQNLLFEVFKQSAGVNMIHIPFKGSGESAMAVMAGRVEVGMDSLGPVLPHAESGKVRILALTSAKGGQGIPGMDTSGVAGFDYPTWTGIGAPLRTPRPVIDTLNAAFNTLFKNPEVRAYYEKVGQTNPGGTPEQFARLLNHEVETWIKVVKSANIQLD